MTINAMGRRRSRTIAAIALLSVCALVFGSSDVVPPKAPSALGAPRFVDEAASAGIDHVYGGGFGHAVGGGAAVLDCDGDGKPDLYLSGGRDQA